MIDHLVLVEPALTRRPGGVQRFAAALVPELQRLVRLTTVAVHPEQPETAGRSTRLKAAARGIARIRRTDREGGGPAAVLSLFHWPPAPPGAPPMVGYVHDLGPPPQDRRRQLLNTAFARGVWRTWAAVAVPSLQIAEAVRLAGFTGRVDVVPEGTDHLHLSSSSVPRDSSLALILGGSAPHKRQELAYGAGEILHREGWSVASIGAGQPPWCTPIGDDSEYASYLERATVAIATTRFEGFGLAIVEAMRAGVPVVTCEDALLPHPTAATLRAPATPAGIAEQVRAVASDRDGHALTQRKAVEPFTWASTARQLLNILEEIV